MRSALFVPANRPDRFPKALASGADAVIIDLEDTISPDGKRKARDNIANFVDTNPKARFWVRINDGTTSWFDDDLSLCRSLPAVSGIVLPKANRAQHVHIVSGAGKPLMPVIEAAAGLRELPEIAKASGVMRLSFGILDLMVELGTRPHTAAAMEIQNQIRFLILMSSCMHGLARPMDCVYADFSDLDGFEQSAVFARDMGFGGVLCIHPNQIPIAHGVFQALPEELDWAQRVVDHADKTGEYTFRMDGRMVDLPLIERARRILERFK